MSETFPETSQPAPVGKIQRSRSLLGSLTLLFGLSIALLLIAAGCQQREPQVSRQVETGFLGNAACANCHPHEFDLHKGSHHNVTMRKVDKESMGTLWPKIGPIKGTDLEIFETDTGLVMGWKDLVQSAVPMQYALGSDRFAVTYISVANNQKVMELRQSYYPITDEWLPTPGDAYLTDNMVARTFEVEASRHCISCHVITLPAEGITPEPRFFGVGCESCHGPGQKHVAAVQAKEKDLQMVRLNSLGATKLNEMCGRCHRNAKDVIPEQADMTNRFAPYGLMLSKCFLKSNDTLSCSTCHDPHKDASTNHKEYEEKCLSCHKPSTTIGPSNTHRKTCPVNPRSGCIPCHMPQREVTVDSPFSMSEHRIRVFSEEELAGFRKNKPVKASSKHP